MDINTNKPYTTSQVSSSKPNIPRSDNVLVGYIANSFNGGHNRTIAWKQVMAGERHKEYKLNLKIKTLTPLTPPYQQLKMTIRSYFVPNSRVWENAEKYTAQKGGTAEIKIKEVPNMGGKIVRSYYVEGEPQNTNMMNTTAWRNAFISSYLPRMGEKNIYDAASTNQTNSGNGDITLPKISILPLRGRIAIYNDMERNKEFDPEIQEFKNNEPTNVEWTSYLPINSEDVGRLNMRAKRENSYYSNFRTEIQGFETEFPPTGTSESDKSLITWGAWEHLLGEVRSQAENAQRNDWDIIAEIRGSKTALQGKVQKIGEKTFNLNYASVTQNAYNNAVTDVNFQVLGQQGAYSYTEIEVPCYAGFEAIEEGYIHIIATVWAESVFEQGIDRLEMNVTPLDQYRPDLKEEKQDVLYTIESGTKRIKKMNNVMQVEGFKRKFSEYFKLPNIIAGDLTNEGYYEALYPLGSIQYSETEIESQKSYQLFEDDKSYARKPNGNIIYKKPWLDYTDLLINKNLAVQEEVQMINFTILGQDETIEVKGQNQIFLVGKATLVADMPIDEAIKQNYTKWGEH